MNNKQDLISGLKFGIFGLIFTYIAFLPAYYYLNISTSSPFFSFPDFIYKNWDKMFPLLIVTAFAALILLMNKLGIKTRSNSDSNIPKEYRINFLLMFWLYICSVVLTSGLIFFHDTSFPKISWTFIAIFYASLIVLALLSIFLSRKQKTKNTSSPDKSTVIFINIFTTLLPIITLFWLYIVTKISDAQLWRIYMSRSIFLIAVTSISTLIAFFFGFAFNKIKSNQTYALSLLNIILCTAFTLPIFILQSDLVKLKYDANMPKTLGLTESISDIKALCIDKNGEVFSYLADPNEKTYLTKENSLILKQYTDNNFEKNFLNFRAANMLLNYYILKGDTENIFAALTKAYQTHPLLDSKINSAIATGLLLSLPYDKKLTPYAKYYTDPENSINHPKQYPYSRALSEKYGFKDHVLYYKNLSNMSDKEYREFLNTRNLAERGTIKGRILFEGNGLPDLSVRAIASKSGSDPPWRTRKRENNIYLDLNSKQDAAGYYYARHVFRSFTKQDGSFEIEGVIKGEYNICILLEGKNSKLSVKKSVKVPPIEKGIYDLGTVELK